MKQILALIVAFFFGLNVQSQTLSLDEFLAIVRTQHPIVKQAAIGVDIAKTEVISARSGFDPLFTSGIGRKEFGGLLYYDQQVTEIKIPTWFGVDVMAGLESLIGNRTSTPETKGNSSYFGFSVPVGKGLLMDKRRAALQQAKVFQSLSLQEQKIVLNDLLYEAAKAYWAWWQQHQVQNLFQQAIKNAEQRFRLVKTSFELGERPAIDTIEALAQLQSFQLRQNEIALDISNAQLEVTVFLWQTGQPYTLPPTVVPQASVNLPQVLQIENLLSAVQQHPELQQYYFKLQALQVDKRLKFQSLLPSVDVKYNQLNGSHNLTKSFSEPWLQNNYRYGIAISLPLRLSEGRGDYRKAKLEIKQMEWEQLNKQLTLTTKLQQQYNEWKALQAQMELQENAIGLFAALQRGEELKFINGESSLFLINTRELKTLEARQKLIELQSKEGKAATSALWAAGLLVTVQR